MALSFDLSLLTGIPPNWRDRARCRGLDTDRFFPAGVTGMAIDQIEAAKTICRDCEVRAPCLEYALETAQECGVWGGFSEDERRRLRRAWRARRRLALVAQSGTA